MDNILSCVSCPHYNTIGDFEHPRFRMSNFGRYEIQTVLHLELMTISRGMESIFSLLTHDSGG